MVQEQRVLLDVCARAVHHAVVVREQSLQQEGNATVCHGGSLVSLQSIVLFYHKILPVILERNVLTY